MTRIIILTIAILLIITSTGMAKLDAGEKVSKTNNEKSDSGTATVKPSYLFDPSLYATPKSIIRKLKKEPGKTILVDVRRKDLFEKARIPGALNVPLFSIKTKAFLKQSSIILVGESVGNGQLQRSCATLNASGFHARILFGGIKLWREAGGHVTGDFFYLDSLNTIPAAHFHSGRGMSRWKIIDVSAASEEKAAALFPGAVSVPFIDGNDAFAEALEKECRAKRRARFSSTLVFSENGTHYPKINKTIKSARLSNLFFLEGGWNGYQEYKQKLALIQHHRKGGKISQKNCPVCP